MKSKKNIDTRILSWGLAIFTGLGLLILIIDELIKVRNKTRELLESTPPKVEQQSSAVLDRGSLPSGAAPFLAERCVNCHRSSHSNEPVLVSRPGAGTSKAALSP